MRFGSGLVFDSRTSLKMSQILVIKTITVPSGLYVDLLDVIYNGPNRSFLAPSELYVYQLDVFYAGPDRSYTAPSELYVDQLDVLYTKLDR